MVKRQEYPRRNMNQAGTGGYPQRPARESQQPQASQPASQPTQQPHQSQQPIQQAAQQPAQQSQQPVQAQHHAHREPNQNRGFNRSNPPRPNHTSPYSMQRHTPKVKVEETVDDIKIDISRIEKEIELEIKEIRSLKLGL